MLLGSFLAGVAAYGFQVVAARALGEVAYAPISSLWTLQYLAMTVLLYPVEAYIAREHARGAAPSVAGKLWAWIIAVAAAVGSLAWLARGRLLAGDAMLAVVAGLIVAGYGVYAVARGRLAGSGRFKAYGFVTASESVLRLSLLVPLVVVAATTRTVAWVMPWGPAVAGALWPWLRRRRPTKAAAAGSPHLPARPVAFLATSTVANGISQVLLAAGPVVVALLHGSAAEVSVFFVTATAARIPFVLAFGGVLSRLLPVFTGMARTARGDAALAGVAWRVVAAALVLAVVGGAAAGWVGDEVVAALFGAVFAPPGWLVAGVVAGVLCIVGATVLNQILLARATERAMLAPWAAGLVVAAVTLVVADGSASLRVLAAFDAGAVVALAGLIAAVATGHSAIRDQVAAGT